MVEAVIENDVVVAVRALRLPGLLAVPSMPKGAVIFAHGAGSGRLSSRNLVVARALQQHGFATLLFDLLSPAEEREQRQAPHIRTDIAVLAKRLLGATQWLRKQAGFGELPVGYFGSSNGAGAALIAAARAAVDGVAIAAVVSRGGRADLAGDALPYVRAATLLIVGGDDTAVLGLNQLAAERLRCPHQLEQIAGAGHLFEEPGALDAVVRLSIDWFDRHLAVGGSP